LPSLYTVGHSNHSFAYFLELLQIAAVDYVIDVRSVAASRFNPQYNRKALMESLSLEGISYSHFGEEFGARRTEPEFYTNGIVDFEKVRRSGKFRHGINMVYDLLNKQHRIVFMCAEADPLTCHRFSMVSVAFGENKTEVKHILKDKSVIPDKELVLQMLEKFKKKIPLGLPYNEKISVALKLLNLKIGFKKSTHNS
jgi:uncharacterized protein (DUF488 family)